MIAWTKTRPTAIGIYLRWHATGETSVSLLNENVWGHVLEWRMGHAMPFGYQPGTDEDDGWWSGPIEFDTPPEATK